MGKPEGKRPLGSLRITCDYNIKMDVSGSGMWVYGLDWAGPG